MKEFKRILFLGCHLDDIEYGCGGLLSQIWNRKENDVDVRMVVLSHENRDAKDNVTINRSLVEARQAIRTLGGRPEDILTVLDYPGQKFQYVTQDIRESLLQIRRDFSPELIFFPAKEDIHQDHHVLYEEALRIFRTDSCVGYEISRSNLRPSPNLYVHLSSMDIARKVRAVACYQSQLKQSAGYYFGEDVIRGMACANGARCGTKYAEAYEIYAWQVKEG